jgi:hypothetical protein
LHFVVGKLNFNQLLIGPKKPCASFAAIVIVSNSDFIALQVKRFPNAIEFVMVNMPVLGNFSIVVKLGKFHHLRRGRAFYLCSLTIRKCINENEYEN